MATPEIFVKGSQLPAAEAMSLDDEVLGIVDGQSRRIPRKAFKAPLTVPDLPALRALTGMQEGQATQITSTGRAGLFRWDSSDLSAEVSSDSMMGIYVPPTGQDGSAGAWVRVFQGVPEASWFGLSGSSSAADFQAAINTVSGLGYTEFPVPFSIASLSAPVDCKGLRILANGHSLPSSQNTLVNHSGIVGATIAGVPTSSVRYETPPAALSRYNKLVFRETANRYRVFIPKDNPSDGLLDLHMEDNVVTSTNSIGGQSDFRATLVRNVNDAVAYQHEYVSASVVPSETVTRPVGSGSGGSQISYFTIAPGESITFAPGGVLSTLSVGFLCTVNSSSDVSVSVGAETVGTISLVSATETQWSFRSPIKPSNEDVTITNNADTGNVYVAGVNYWRLHEPEMQGGVDTIAYSYRTFDYIVNKGAWDYALRRHPDDYAGSDLTGGSYHGGETIAASTWMLDGAAPSIAVGDVYYGKDVRHTSNVNVIWPSDSASVNVVRQTNFIDGGVMRYMRIRPPNDMVFDAVWTAMVTTSPELSVVRGAAQLGTGISASMKTFERTNLFRQERGTQMGIETSFTLFDNERNSNGGPYINEVNTPTGYHKLYYGPILFNKGTLPSEINCQQISRFYGKG